MKYTEYWRGVGKNASIFDPSSFSVDVKRQLGMLQYNGAAALTNNETISEVCIYLMASRQKMSPILGNISERYPMY